MKAPNRRHSLLIALVLGAFVVPVPAQAQPPGQRTLILAVGAAGEEPYAREFAAEADLWKQAARKGGFQSFVIGEDEKAATDDRTQLLNVLTNEVATTNGEELWLVFIGHGTFDGRSAKFNLRGPDISADDVKAALNGSRRPFALIQCASASGPFLPALSAASRTIITATRSGYEANATRFGQYFARAVADPAADLDKDGQTSLLEAFLLASRQVEQFYRDEGRLATEHALLDDNGDGLGTAADWFRGVRAVKTAAGGKSVDGVRAHQLNLVRSEAERELSPEVRGRRDALEQQLSALRTRKSAMDESTYYAQIEGVLVQIARLYATNSIPGPAVREAPESNPGRSK